MPESAQPSQRRWSPYTANGGTVLALAGEDFCIVAGDSRLSEGYSICTRNKTKLKQLSNTCVLGSAGMSADCAQLWKTLNYKCVMYKHRNKKDMSTEATAQMLSSTLYYKRFFPYYAMNVLGGLDKDGKGIVYKYDSIGSFEKCYFGVKGTAGTLLMPVFDNQVEFKTHLKNKVKLSLEETIDIVKDAFNGCAERDIYTGDNIHMAIITKDGVRMETSPLRRD